MHVFTIEVVETTRTQYRAVAIMADTREAAEQAAEQMRVSGALSVDSEGVADVQFDTTQRS